MIKVPFRNAEGVEGDAVHPELRGATPRAPNRLRRAGRRHQRGNDVAWPGTSNLSWSGPNENVAVTTLTAVDANTIGNLYASQATDVAVDVLGSSR